MASSEILTETLHSVTSIKIAQLDKQKQTYESAKQSLLEKAELEADSRKRVRLLADGSEKLPSMTPLASHPLLGLENMRQFVEQAEFDPSISEDVLADYENIIRNQLDAQTAKYDFAELYGELVKEWTSSNNTNESESESGFVSLGREEMHQQRATWEEYVFQAKQTDTAATKAYLDNLFVKSPSTEVANEFEVLRKEIIQFQKDWDRSTHFNQDVVIGCIKSILRSDVISDSKRSALGDFMGNKVVLDEIADVMNMRMATRKSFVLDGPTVIEQRRQLNGRYRFYPDEDVLQTIFLEYIGLKWATELKRVLIQFTFAGGVLKSHSQTLTKEAARRRRFFLGSAAKPTNSVANDTETHWKKDIFLDQLPNEMFEQRGAYGEEKADGGQEGDDRASSLVVTQELLHRIQAHIIMQRKLKKNTCVIRSDFKWFGPSLPHSSIFVVLDYLGVQEEWLDLFKKVLEAPLRFKDDTPGSAPQIRKRGTPIGTPLAKFFGEALLFCLDFAVNQKTDGARLYRLHDDLWLWGEGETCSRGWNTLTEFSSLMGLKFNEEKTGSCQVLADGFTESTAITASLPRGDVVWGFLKLDAASGQFVINQPKVNLHIEELSLQLKACKSIFDFVLAWNIYGSRFFQTNCGKVSWCTTRQQVDEILETFQRIQSQVFQSSKGSVGQHLKEMIRERLGVSDIPDGFLYYPTSLGGLGLQNPLINLYLVRRSTVEGSEKFMEHFYDEEESNYRTKKRAFEELETSAESTCQDEDLGDWGDPSPRWSAPKQSSRAAHGFPELTGEWNDLRNEPFMSFEEFIQHREVTSHTLGMHHRRLLSTPQEHSIEILDEPRHPARRRASYAVDKKWTNYERWVIQLYAKEMVARFGSLNVVEKGLLPAGLITMLRQSRFTWQN